MSGQKPSRRRKLFTVQTKKVFSMRVFGEANHEYVTLPTFFLASKYEGGWVASRLHFRRFFPPTVYGECTHYSRVGEGAPVEPWSLTSSWFVVQQLRTRLLYTSFRDQSKVECLHKLFNTMLVVILVDVAIFGAVLNNISLILSEIVVWVIFMQSCLAVSSLVSSVINIDAKNVFYVFYYFYKKRVF